MQGDGPMAREFSCGDDPRVEEWFGRRHEKPGGQFVASDPLTEGEGGCECRQICGIYNDGAMILHHINTNLVGPSVNKTYMGQEPAANKIC